jgi:hypothetical protein
MNPIIKNNKNNKTVKYPKIPILEQVITHGINITISKSKIKYKIAITENVTSKRIRELVNGSNPHSYADNFSASIRNGAKKRAKRIIKVAKTVLNKK